MSKFRDFEANATVGVPMSAWRAWFGPEAFGGVGRCCLLGRERRRARGGGGGCLDEVES